MSTCNRLDTETREFSRLTDYTQENSPNTIHTDLYHMISTLGVVRIFVYKIVSNYKFLLTTTYRN